jgi:2-keto-4-pentenoate hydratase/2-oxohepta-3-ene-1,7-dioic acid hydratase in catechol pathway
MRWVSYLGDSGEARVGLVEGQTIRGVRGVRALIDLLGDDDSLESAAQDARDDPLEVIKLDDARLLAPIPVPPSIRDFMAFEEHVVNASRRGGGVDPGWYERPAFYFTNPAAVRGPDGDVAVPPGSTRLDYELEVAAVVGKGGSDLHPDSAEEHIAGYMILCDWSARDLQIEEMRQRLGPVKGKDSATTLGPYLVTPDELEPFRSGRGYDLEMTATVNGKLYSSGNWSTIYWSFAEMLAYASRGTRLVPGDVLGSGTVGSGCLMELSGLHGEEAYPWLVPGDEICCEVAQLGRVTGRIVPGVPPVPLRRGRSSPGA